MINKCLFCGNKRDETHFFWLEIDKTDEDECCSYMELENPDYENYDYIQIECCPNCQAEII